MRQDERQQEHEYADGDDQSPCTRVYFTRYPAFGRFDVTLETVEVAVVGLAHRPHPVDACGSAGAPTPGMPRPTPVRGRTPAAWASPALVRRWVPIAESAIRWCGAAPVIVVVTTSPGRICRPSGLKCTSRPSRARPDIRAVAASLRPSPVATSSSTVLPISRGVLFEGDPLLEVDQSLIALGHNVFGHLAIQVGGGGSWPLRVLEGECAGEPRLLDDVERGLEVGLGFAGESDDDVGGDRGVRNGGTDAVDDPEVALGTVGPSHRPQDSIRS